MEQEIGTWDSVLLENLSEDSFINNVHQRYKRDHIYTYIGTSVVAVNPYHHISEHSMDIIQNYGSKGIFQLAPHIYGLTNLAFQSLKDQSEDQCILLTGESGAGKTESFKMIVNFLTHIQDKMSTSQQHSKNRKQSAIDVNMLNRVHRRASSSCSPSTNFIICKNLPAAMSTSSASNRRQSPSPGITARRCDAIVHRSRAESSDRQSRRNAREKIVDFDFSHHKSSENISTLDSVAYGGGGLYPHSHLNPTKSCFKHQQPQTYCHTGTYAACSSGSDCFGNNAGVSGTTRSASTGNASPKFFSSASASASAAAGCRLCGHSRCTRAQSLEKDEKELLLRSARVSTHQIAPVTNDINETRQLPIR